MRFFELLVPLVLLSLADSVAAVGGVCAQIVHGNFYDLGKLSSDYDYVMDVNGISGKIYFNLCDYSRMRCPGAGNSFAVFKSEDRCIPLTSSSLTGGYNSSLIKYSNGTSGLNITFSGVVPYDGPNAANNSTFKVEFDLRCIPDNAENRWNNPSPVFFPDNSTFVVTGEGAAHCPKYSGSFLVDFLDKFSFINALLAIIAGAGLCFYGYKVYKPTIFTIGFIFGFISIGLFLFAVWTSQDSSNYKGWVILALALAAGVGSGMIVTKFAWVGLVISGSILGFFICMILYTLILYRIISYPPNLLFYNLLWIGLAAGAIAGYEFQEVILVLSCGISGAYMAIRGISVFFGGFPNEFELATKFKSGQNSGIGFAFYFYMILMACMAVGGIYYQKKLKTIDKERETGNDLAEKLANNEDDD